MLLTLSLITLLITVATLIPMWRNPHWSVRGFDFPRAQIAVIASILLLAQLIFLPTDSALTWGLIIVTLLCISVQLWWILPYTPLWIKEVATATANNPDHCIRVLTSNVLTPNRNAEALITLVNEYQPDILVTLESDQWWQDQLDALSASMPYSVKCPLDNLYGMHVYSRLPLEEEEVRYLVEKDVPSIHAMLKLPTGDSVRVHFLHPAPPSPTENDESEERDAELIVVARSLRQASQPVIVTGDLNDVAWSATTRLFRKISGLLDPRVGRGMFNTFHADYRLLRWPVDHLFHSHHFTLHNMQRLPSISSDHFPLLTELVLNPVDGKHQSGITAGADDQQQAKAIADQEEVSKHDIPRPGER